jgi:hypothetical protein
MKKRNLWHKFIECDCGAEGVMLSTEDYSDDKGRQIYLAFFQNGFKGRDLSFKDKLRWTWQIWSQGVPWGDTVLLNVGNAILLKHYLSRWIDGKWPRWYKPEPVKKAKKSKLYTEPVDVEIDGLYHPERAL